VQEILEVGQTFYREDMEEPYKEGKFLEVSTEEKEHKPLEEQLVQVIQMVRLLQEDLDMEEMEVHFPLGEVVDIMEVVVDIEPVVQMEEVVVVRPSSRDIQEQ
jgi:hypothetical protein